MKIDFYVDIWEGQTSDTLTATTRPCKRIKGSRRYKITADIPEEAFKGKIEKALPESKVTEILEEGNQNNVSNRSIGSRKVCASQEERQTKA